MSEYLIENPPARRQFRDRRGPVSGVIVLHSAENSTDVVGPDGGAEAVASFIRGRPTPGSYHVLCDSDSTIRLVPFRLAAFHDGTGTNDHSIGVSAAFEAHRLQSLPPDRVGATVDRMADAARVAAGYVQAETGVVVPARRITVAQARARQPGFVTHGMLDPGRRTDPDGTNDGSGWPWERFLARYQQEDLDDMGWSRTDATTEVQAAFADIAGREVDPAPANWVAVVERDGARGALRLQRQLIREMRVAQARSIAAASRGKLTSIDADAVVAAVVEALQS